VYLVEEIVWRVLVLTASRGHIGAAREDFFREIRGVAYKDLQEAVNSLEKDGLVTVEWTGPNKFLCFVSEKGSLLAKEEYQKRLKAYRDRMESQQKAAAGGLDKV
jgi:hypothetical protein